MATVSATFLELTLEPRPALSFRYAIAIALLAFGSLSQNGIVFSEFLSRQGPAQAPEPDLLNIRYTRS